MVVVMVNIDSLQFQRIHLLVYLFFTIAIIIAYLKYQSYRAQLSQSHARLTGLYLDKKFTIKMLEIANDQHRTVGEIYDSIVGYIKEYFELIEIVLYAPSASRIGTIHSIFLHKAITQYITQHIDNIQHKLCNKKFITTVIQADKSVTVLYIVPISKNDAQFLIFAQDRDVKCRKDEIDTLCNIISQLLLQLIVKIRIAAPATVLHY